MLVSLETYVQSKEVENSCLVFLACAAKLIRRNLSSCGPYMYSKANGKSFLRPVLHLFQFKLWGKPQWTPHMNGHFGAIIESLMNGFWTDFERFFSINGRSWSPWKNERPKWSNFERQFQMNWRSWSRPLAPNSEHSAGVLRASARNIPTEMMHVQRRAELWLHM